MSGIARETSSQPQPLSTNDPAPPSATSIPFSLPSDKEWLAPPVCLLREQLEAFAATPQDVAERKTGVKPVVGQVGIRCVHCAHLDPNKRAKGAVSYPKSTTLLHQAVRNFQRHHFFACEKMPAEIKEKLISFTPKKLQSRMRSGEYWIQSSRDVLGMVNVEEALEGTTSTSDRNKGSSKAAGHAHIRFVAGHGCDDTAAAAAAAETAAVDVVSEEAPTATRTSASCHNENNRRGRARYLSDASDFSLSALDEIDVCNAQAVLAEISSLQEGLPASVAETKTGYGPDSAANAGGGSSGSNAHVDKGPSLQSPTCSLAPLDAVDLDGSGTSLWGEHSADYILDCLGPDDFDSSQNKSHRLDSEQSTSTATADTSSIGTSDAKGSSVMQAAAATTSTASISCPPCQGDEDSGPTSSQTASTTAASQDTSTSSVGTASTLASAPPSARSPFQVQLLRTLQSLLSLVQATKQSPDRPNLVEIGKSIYQGCTGAEAPCNVTMGSEVATTSSDAFLEEAQEALASTSIEEEGRSGMKSRSKRQRPRCTSVRGTGTLPVNQALQDAGIPVQLNLLIMSLLAADYERCTERYLSIDEVERELLCMLAEPDRHLFDLPPGSQTGRLEISQERLYGREKEWTSLKSSFDRVFVSREERSGLVIVDGYAGSGKTSLVQMLKSPLCQQRGMFVSVKFDVQGREKPMSAIFRALENYCQDLLHGDQTLLAEVGLAVKKALWPSGAILKELIPSLGIVIGGWGLATFDMDNTDTYNMIVHFLRVFVRAISGPTHPVIILLDDLQWADKASLELVKDLIIDAGIHSMMFIGCYREEEVPNEHPLRECFGEITMAAVPTAIIDLDDLDRENVNELVSDTLHLSPRLTRPLAESLHAKSRGNPMFIRQLMLSFYEEGLLWYSASSRRWEWDIQAIRAKDIPDNAVGLILDMMKSYGPDVQRVLCVASCLGSRFDSLSLEVIISSDNGDGSGVSCILHNAVADGLINKEGSAAYRFSHDQIWQAAYALTPLSAREKAHLHIGRLLLSRISEDQLDSMLIILVDQYNRGSSLIVDHEEKLTLAKLNQKAGEKALLSLSFLQASVYLLQGCVLVEATDWGSNYDLCIRLFTSCSEVQFACGNNEGAVLSLTPVLDYGKCLRDKLRAYYTLVTATGAQGNIKEAVVQGLSVLEQLGESFPTDIDEAVIARELGKTQALLAMTTVDDILRLPGTANPEVAFTMRCILRTSMIAYSTCQASLQLLLNLRSVQKALTEGLTPEASYAFAGCSAALLCSGNLELSSFCSTAALALLDKYNHKYSQVVLTLLNASILQYNQPMQACVESFRRAYADSICVGDIDIAVLSFSLMIVSCVFVPVRGRSLKDVEIEIRQKTLETKLNNNSLNNIYLVYFQAILNLSEDAGADGSDPTVLTNGMIDVEAKMSESLEKQRPNPLRKMYFCRMWLAYLFRRYSIAAEMLELHQEMAKATKLYSSIEVIHETFYAGLIAASLLRQNGDDKIKWRSLVEAALNQLSNWAELGSEWNFRHKLDLLKAEKSFSENEMEAAAASYESAIRGAKKHCFINEEALACERAGIFYFDNGSMDEARKYLGMAKQLYSDWGAKRKVNDVAALLQEV